MADNINVTPGSGATVTTESISDMSEAQIIKLAISTNGSRTLVPSDATNGLDVDVTRVQGNVTVVSPTASNFKVDGSSVNQPVVNGSGTSLKVAAPSNAPVAVQLSDGTNPITGLPISGSVAASQGTPNTVDQGWPIKITDGSATVGITDVASAKALKVDVLKTVDPASVVVDKSAFTEGTQKENVSAGVYLPTRAGDVPTGAVTAFRTTAKGDQQVSLVTSAGLAHGTDANPVSIKIGASPGTLPVSGTVTAQMKDSSGASLTPANPLPVALLTPAVTRVSKSILLAASQSAVEIWIPSSGTKFVIDSLQLAITGAGTLTLFEDSATDPNIVVDGNQSTGNRQFDFAGKGWRATTADKRLKYNSGGGLAGQLVIHGHEE